MADKIIKGLSIQIGADTIGLDKALKDVESKSRAASSELRAINGTIKTAGDSAVLWRQKQQLLNDAISRSKEKLKILEDAQKGFTERFRSGEIDKGTYDKFREKLTKAKDKLKDLKSQQEQIDSKFKNGEIDQGKYDKFCKAVENAEERVKKLETAERSMEENLRIGNISEEQYRAFQREMEYARATVEKYETGLKEANTKIRELGDESSDTADDVKELGDKADGTASGGISAMTVAIGNLVADGIKKAASELKDFTADVIHTGASFEAAMSNVGAISGASAGDLEILTAKAEEMGATTKFTAKESADAFQYMAMAGWKTNDMISGIDGIMNLAAASGEDLATTSDIVTDALTAFGLQADDSGHFADVLAAASSNANTNVSMLGETFKYVAPVASALNISVEDIAVAIGLLANSGIKSSQAGTTLRTILTRLSTDAGASSKSLGALGVLTEELGVDFYDTEGKVRDFGTILAEARQQWQTLSAEDSAAFAKKIAGEEGISGWLALMNAAPADIEKLSGAIRDCDGAATDMSTTMIDNLQGDMTILDSAVDGMKISLSKKLNPALRDITQYITSKMPEIEKSIEKVGSKAIKVLDFSIKNLPKAIDLLKKSMPFIKGVGAGFAAWKLGEGVKKLKDFYVSLGGINGAVKLLAAAAKGNPFGAIVTGLGIAIPLAVKLADAFSGGKSELQKFTEEQEAYRKKVDETIESTKSMITETDQEAAAVDREFDNVEKLWKELDKLTDSNGHVKAGQQDHAQYILNELNDALGTEYTMIDNQIQQYDILKDSIQAVIDKKRAERLLSVYQQNEAQLIQQQSDARKEMQEQQVQIDEKQAEYDVLKAKAHSYLDENGNITDFISYDEAVRQMNNKYGELSQLRASYDKTEESFMQATAELNKNAEAERLIMEGKYDDAVRVMTAELDADKKILSSSKATEAERNKAYTDSLKKMQTSLDLAIKSRNEGYKEDAKNQINAINDEADELISLMFEQGAKNADVYTGEFKKVIKKMTDNGFDISGLTKWAKKSGLSTADVFGGKYRDVVQKQIDEGYDATDLLVWGVTCGEDLGGILSDKTIEKLSSIDKFDTEKIRKFIEKESQSWGGMFTGNMWKGFAKANDAIADMLTKTASSKIGLGNGNLSGFIKNNMNKLFSEIDWATQPLKMYAQGGFCTDRGIVAEAGPELIEIINGGVKVTPLTSTARNTVVNPTDQKPNVYYNNYTINATVGNRYDVTRIAEQLAAEQRRIEGGKGR